MTKGVQSVLVIIGVVLGVPVGAWLGFYGLFYGGPLVFGPAFGQVGWVFTFFTVPCGALLGGLLGGFTLANRPRLFLLTILPLAIVIFGLEVTLRTLRAMDRPRTFVLDVVGTPGADYVGIVSVDGVIQTLKGKVPEKHTFKGLEVELAFVLGNAKGGEDIAVEVSADGHSLNIGHKSQTGVHLHLKSFGYSETYGGTSPWWLRMTQEEVDALINEHRMPALPLTVRSSRN